MSIPKAPQNVFVNLTNNYAIIVWDKVIKDIDNNYTKILAYYIYKTDNPSKREWTLLKKIVSKDEFDEVDTFYIDFSAKNQNYLYKICAENDEGVGLCSVSYGVISSGEILEFSCAKWDFGKFDENFWC